MDSDSDGVFTDMLFAPATVAAMTACQMALAGNSFTHFEIGHPRTHFFDISHILMTNDHWGPDCFL